MNALAVADWTEFPSIETTETAERGYLVVLERAPESWGAYVPDLPGLAAAAETETEVRSLIAEAVEFHIEGLRAEGQSVPEPTTTALWVLDEP